MAIEMADDFQRVQKPLTVLHQNCEETLLLFIELELVGPLFF